MSRYKSDGTTRDDNGPIILRPVSIADAKGVLNENSNDLGTLCKSTKINPWSRRKPIRKTNIGELSESDFANAKYGFNVNVNIDDIFPIIDKNNIHATGNTVKSLLPYGTASSPYRLTDFDGYNHEAPALFSETTRHPKYNSSISVYNWCYSLNRDAENLKNSKSDSVNELVDEDGANHLFDRNASAKYHLFSYVYGGEQRYREIQLSNVLNFSTLQNTVTNPQKTDPLSIGEIFGNVDLSTSTFVNYAFGLIMTINGVNYLYNTKLPITALFTQSQVKESAIALYNQGGQYIKLLLAEKTAQALNIYVYPWLIATRDSTTLPTVVIDNMTLPVMTYQNAQSKLPSEGTTIKTRLCLCPRLQTDYSYSAYFKQIVAADPNLYSCELKTGACCNRDIIYKKYSVGSAAQTKETYGLYTGFPAPSYPPHIPSIGFNGLSSTVSVKIENNKRYWNIIGILKVSGFYIYLSYIKQNLVNHTDTTSDPYYGMSSGYKTYGTIAHTSTTSTSVARNFYITCTLGSGTVDGATQWEDSSHQFIRQDEIITSYHSTSNMESVMLASGGLSNSPKLHVTKIVNSISQSYNVDESYYSGFTDILGGLQSLNKVLYFGDSMRLVEAWWVPMSASSFNAMTVRIQLLMDSTVLYTVDTTLANIFGTQN